MFDHRELEPLGHRAPEGDIKGIRPGTPCASWSREGEAVSTTAEKRQHPGTDAPTRPLYAVQPEHGPLGEFRTVLLRYLVGAFLLLFLVILVRPAQIGAAEPETAPWKYQREQVEVQGGGVLNAYARVAMRSTAWMARSSIERQRDVYRLGLFDFLVGGRTAQDVGGWREGNRQLLRVGTQLALLGLVAYGILVRPNARTWVLAILLLLAATVVITRPQATVQKAAALGTAVPNVMLGAVSQVAPSRETDGAPNADEAQKRLSTRYWDSFVAHPLSRVQTGTAVLATADPAHKPSLLQSLGKNISGVHDWAIGRHGAERAFIATSAVGYILPFALTLGVLAMVAACAQTLLFLLCLAGLFAVPLAVQGPRRRGQLIRWWLLPLLATVALLAFTSLLSLTVMRVANALHSSDEYVGVLLAGSTWPIVALVLIRWRLARRRGKLPRRGRLLGSDPS
jgi:hypothetical protein